jgi:hypothetical protein
VNGDGNGSANGRTPYTIGGTRADGSAGPVGPWWAGRGIPDARPPLPGSGGDGNGIGDGNGADHAPGGFVEPEEVATPRGIGAGMPFAVLAAATLFVMTASSWFFPSPVLPRVLVPVFGILATIAAARWLAIRHPDEPWLARLMVLAVIAKLVASFLRWRTLVNSYGDVGDASVFDIYGKRYSGFWLGTAKVGP